MRDQPTYDKLMSCVRYLEECDPLYGYVGSCLVHEELPVDEESKTVDIDGKMVRYNPDFISGLSSPDIRTILRHEYGHAMLAHPARMMEAYGRGTDGSVLLVAADLAVNDLLRTNREVSQSAIFSRFALPRGTNYEHIPTGLSFEGYVRLLGGEDEKDPDARQENSDGNSGDDGGGVLPDDSSGVPGDDGSGPSADDRDGTGEGDESGGDSDSGESGGSGELSDGGDSSGDGASDGEGGGEGDGAEGDPLDGGEAQGDAEGGSNPSRQGRGRDDVRGSVCLEGGKPDGETTQLTGNDIRFPSQSVQESIQESEFMVVGAVNAVKERGEAGSVPGSLLKTVEAVVTPRQPDWRKLLENTLLKLASVRQSWAKRSRRQTWESDMLVPGKSGRQLKKMGLVVDTSGSITNTEYAVVLEMLKSVSSTFTCSQVRIIECDTAIQRDVTFPTAKLSEVEMFKGGGGTCLVPAFAAMEEDKIDVLVCITDGEFSDEINYRKAPVIWLLTGQMRTFPCGVVVAMPVN